MKWLCLFVVGILAACSPIQQYKGVSLEHHERATVLIQKNGNSWAGEAGLRLIHINEQGKTEEMPRYSTSRIEFEPGEYEFGVKVWGKGGMMAGMISGMAGAAVGGVSASQASINVSMYGTGGEAGKGELKATLEAGHVYLLRFKRTGDSQVSVWLEDI